MRISIMYLLIALLSTSCVQGRYRHLTVKVKDDRNIRSDPYLQPKDAANSEGMAHLRSKGLVLPAFQKEGIAKGAPDLPARILPLRAERCGRTERRVLTVRQPPRIQWPMMRADRGKSPVQEEGKGLKILNLIGVAIIVLLFIAAIAWLWSLFGFPFWTVFWICLGVFLIALLFGKSDIG